MPDWGAEQRAEAKRLRDELGFFSKASFRNLSVDEYPNPQ
jgi:hypothetical protein